MKLKLKFALFFINIFLYNFLQGADYTLEELNELKNQNAITVEDYEILKAELNKEISGEGEGLYTLKINGKIISNIYSCIEKEGQLYLNLNQFLKLINLQNYEENEKKAKIFLGDSLKEIELNFDTGKIYDQGQLYKTEGNWFIKENGDIFLKKDVFTHLFLNFISVEKNNLLIEGYLSFTPPSAINGLLDITENKLKQKEKEKELVYKGERQLFDVGYARIKLSENFIKGENEKKFKSDWSGDIEYQGPLLYGEVTTSYDIRNKELNTIKLEYNDIWKEHTFEIENRRADSSREWGIRFYKDKGFYNLGEKVIIKENVPLGSRVELLYMNTPIAIANEENGSVVFDSDMIKTDRTYELKIYTQDGKITVKTIKTTEDYNRQSKNEVKYDFSADERKSEGGKYTLSGNVFYGITDNFTLGTGFSRDTIDTKDGTKYAESGNLELIYGGVYNGYSYTLKTGGEKSFNSFEDSSEKSLKDRYKYNALGEVSFDKYKIILSQENFGKFYDEKQTNKLEFQYNLTNNFRVNYDYKVTEKYLTEKEREGKVGFDADWKYKNILFNGETKFNINDSDDNDYSVSAYYGGWQNMTVRLENRWTKSGKNYETTLSLYNNNFGGLFDFSTELKYSKEDKESLTFKMSFDIDNWFTFDSMADKNGRREVSVGIDKVIDLKNPMVNLDNIDVSRVNVTTFVDENNNDIYDEGESLIDGVEVNIGQQKVVTDKNGRGIFYGVSNGLLYDLKPTIKKPSYTLGDNKIKVLSTYSSTVEAYIPIKPMINLTGYVDLDKALNLNEQEKEDFYSDVLIEIKNKDGETLELASPDNTGYFDVSGLFPDEYLIEVTYLGTKYVIPRLKSDLKLSYQKSEDDFFGFEYKIALNISNKDIKLLSKL